MAGAGAVKLLPVPIQQDKVVGVQYFTKAHPIALHPEAAPIRRAQGQVAERHVAVAFHFEDSAGAGEVIELRA